MISSLYELFPPFQWWAPVLPYRCSFLVVPYRSQRHKYFFNFIIYIFHNDIHLFFLNINLFWLYQRIKINEIILWKIDDESIHACFIDARPRVGKNRLSENHAWTGTNQGVGTRHRRTVLEITWNRTEPHHKTLNREPNRFICQP